MTTIIDSLNTLKNSYDFLSQHLIHSNSLFPLKIGEPSVQAALIISFTTILTVILGFIFKDFWIPGWIDSRKRKKDGKHLFKRYQFNLFNSSYTLAYRLQEIYKSRSLYLAQSAPQSNFYIYKYMSSVYRLCALLGWIRAYKLAEPSITLTKKESNNLSTIINDFSSCLADGQKVEMQVAKSICKLNNINIETVAPEVLVKFSVAVDHLVQDSLLKNEGKHIIDLPEGEQSKFILNLKELMTQLNLDSNSIEGKKKEIIQEVSIKLGLIYRDWQQAIGDLMLEKPIDSLGYKVIGYKRFEEMWSMDNNSEEKKWLNRVESMFKNLDINTAVYSDSRIEQLKQVYNHIYKLLEALYNIDAGIKLMDQTQFNKLPKSI